MSALLRVADLRRSEIDGLLASARERRRGRPVRRLADAMVALVFFEDSLRTRVGFDVAAARLGARTTTVLGARHTAQMSAPESLEDLLRCLEPMVDVVCLRHPSRDAPDRACAAVSTPLVNCGNGDEEHPTQALADLFAIAELRGEIDGVSVAVVGDLRHMRAAHSLLAGLAFFDGIRVRCVSPPELPMPAPYKSIFAASGNALEETHELDVGDVDFVYMAGFPACSVAGDFTEAHRARFRLDRNAAAGLRPAARILCPLPRVDEIACELDDTPHAAYFEQNALGMAMRVAVLEHVTARPTLC